MKFGRFSKAVKPAAPNHTRKYNADGTGRDTYVLREHEGGEFAAEVGRFYQTLRKYGGGRRMVTENSEERSRSKGNGREK